MSTFVCKLCNNRVFALEEGYRLHCTLNGKHLARVKALGSTPAPTPPVQPASLAPSGVPSIVQSKRLRCVNCKEEFSSYDNWNNYYQETHVLRKIPSSKATIRVKCGVCTRDFPFAKDLTTHQSTHPTCHQCKIQFQDNDAYEKHKGREHTYPCPTCNLGFSTLRLRQEHQCVRRLEQYQPIHCTFCVEDFSSIDMLREHVKDTHHKKYCDQCDLVFLTEDDNAKHVATSSKHHMVVIKSTCDKDIQTEPEKNKTATPSSATVSDEPNLEETEPLKMAPSQTKVFCSLCRLFVPVQDLEAHFRISPNHPSCNLCDIGFENNLTLTKHFFSSHAELCCDTCGLAFQGFDQLEEHYAESGMHVSCSVCNHGFKNDITLQEHVEAGCHESVGSPEPETQIFDPAPLNDAAETKSNDGNEVINLISRRSPSIVSNCVNLVERPASVSSFATSYRTSVSGPSLDLSEVATEEVQAGSPERNSSRIDLYKSPVIPSSPSPQPRSTMGAEELVEDIVIPSSTLRSVTPSSVTASQAVPPNKNSFNCRVCEHTPEEPVATMCGHLFCLRCLIEGLAKHGRCPACDSMILLRLQV